MRLRVVLLALAILCTVGPRARAAPSPEELLPIEIPLTSAISTPFAKALKSACDSIQPNEDRLPDLAQVKVRAYTPDPLVVWNARKEALAAKKTPSKAELAQLSKLKAAALESVAVLAEACSAIRGTIAFTEPHLDSIRVFAREPVGNDKLVRALILDTTATAQSGVPLAGLLPGDTVGEAVIGGLANFIYSRAKAEAMTFLASRLANLLCADDVRPFFVHVCAAFGDLDASVSIAGIGTYLAAAARKDLERLPDVALVYALHGLTDRQTQRCSDGAACEALTMARVGLAFYDDVKHGRRALDVARALHAIEFSPLQKIQGHTSIDVVTLGSQIVDAIMRQEGWHALKSGGAGEMPYYAIGTLLTLDELRGNWTLTIAHLNQFDRALLRKLATLVQRAADVRDRIQNLVTLLNQPPSSQDEDENEFEPKPQVTRVSRSDLARAASSALLVAIDAGVDVAPVLGLASSPYVHRVQAVIRLGELIASGEAPADVAIEARDLYVRVVGRPSSGTVAGVTVRVARALPIVTQLAKAESADEVATILEAAAAPVGSYRQKSKRRMVSITAFVGGAAGQEYIENEWGTPINVFAPIGLHASWPAFEGNVGLFVSLVNLGNLVSQRFDEDARTSGPGEVTTISGEPSQSIEQVFSPGVFLSTTIAGPFVFGAGVQVVPGAREVTTTTMLPSGALVSETKDRSAVQLLGFIGIDVTIFPF